MQFSFATGLRTLTSVAYNPMRMTSGTSIASASVARSPIRDILDRALAGERLTEADAIALIASGKLDLEGLVDAHFPLESSEEALTVARRDPSILKPVVRVTEA